MISKLWDSGDPSNIRRARTLLEEELVRTTWDWVVHSEFMNYRYDQEFCEKYKIVEDALVWTSRDYRLFSALADVRTWHDGVIPIAEPRGVPPDASPRVKREEEKWGEDGHTHSWLLLSEILEYRVSSTWTEEMVLSWKDFLDGPVARVKAMADEKGDRYDNWRYVFWFDN